MQAWLVDRLGLKPRSLDVALTREGSNARSRLNPGLPICVAQRWPRGTRHKVSVS